jgi:Synergist-CTERM protein sorting domain-containing protein
MPGKKVTKAFVACSAMLLVLLFSAFTTEAAVWTVENGESIQDAIDSASTGDTIQVEPGTYVEYLEVNKGLTIMGTGEGVVLRTPGGEENLVRIPSSNVTLEGLTFEAIDEVIEHTAVYMYGSIWNVQVRNCTFRDVEIGLRIDDASMNVVVANNTFENVRDYGIYCDASDPVSLYFRILSIGNRFNFEWGPDEPGTAHYAESRLGNISFFNTFEDYEGHTTVLYTPTVSDDYLFNAEDNYWGEGAEQSDINAACSPQVDFEPWSLADAAGHTDYQLVPVGGSAVFDVGASEGITVSIEEMTTMPPPSFPLALAAYGDESPRPTTVQDDNPDADSYTAYFHLKDVEPGLAIAFLSVRMTLEIPKSAIGDEADLDDLVLYAYDSGAWVDITDEEEINIEVDSDVVRIVVENYGDPVPIAITAGNGDTSSSGCSSTGAASLGLMLLAPFALAFRRKP